MELNSRQSDDLAHVVQEGTSKSSKLWSLLHLLSLSTIIGLITWSITSYIDVKKQQQQQLDTFVESLAELMVEHKLYASQIAQLQAGSATGKPTNSSDFPEPVVARAYVLNTLNSFNGIWPIEDTEKKQELLKFLYEAKMIGWCPSLIGDTGVSTETTGTQNEACKEAKVSLKDSNLKGVKFREVNQVLSGINLTGKINLKSADFSGLELTNATLINSDLMKADFSSTILQNTDLSRTALQNATFRGAVLTGANFNGAQICGADFRDAVGLEKASFQGASYDANTSLPLDATGKPLQLSGAYLRRCFDPPDTSI